MKEDYIDYIVVVPNGRYVFWESANMRGSPACHAVDPSKAKRTLCGKNPYGWDVYTSRGDGYRKAPKVDCKNCLRAIRSVNK